MEVVGLVASVASLATVFQTAVEYFEYVQLAKNFGIDFQSSCLKLDIAYLKLTRWGGVVGLAGRPEDVKSLESVQVPRRDVQRAEELLGHIVLLFQKAEEASNTFKSSHGGVDAVDIADVDLGKAKALHQKIRELCHRRQKAVGGVKKAKWAVYEKEHLEDLIENVRGFVNDLVDLFPAINSAQASLCDGEAVELQGEPALPILRTELKEDDLLLENALARLIRDQSNSYSIHNSGNTKIVNQVQREQVINGGQTINF